MNVKGLKVNDILRMSWSDIEKLNRNELATLTSRVTSVANKRIKRLESAKLGKQSFAYQKYEEQGRKFTVRGKGKNELKNELSNAMRFVRYKTSSVKGWNKYRTEMEERMNDVTDGESIDWSNRTWSKYWKVYRKFEENHRGSMKKGDSERFQKFIKELFASGDKRKSADYFQQQVESKYAELYEQSMEEIEDETEETEIDIG